MYGNNWSIIKWDIMGRGNKADLWQPSFLGQKVVVLSSTPDFWDLAKTNCNLLCAILWMRCYRLGFIATDLTKHFENRRG